MWEKRGELDTKLIFVLVELALIAMFLAVVMTRINGAVNDQTYYQRFYARDLALLADSISSAEGDFSMQYEVRTTRPVNLNFYLKSGLVTVLDAKEGEEINKVEFLFGKSRLVTAQASSSIEPENPRHEEDDEQFIRIFSLKKEGAKMEISDPVTSSATEGSR